MGWPATDNLDDGDPFVDTDSPVAWARCVPWTVDSSTGYGGSMLSFRTADVYLYNGWHTTPSSAYQQLGGPSATPIVCTETFTNVSEPSAFLFRDYVTTNATVEISFNESGHQALQALITDRSLYIGVGMRIGGGGSVIGGGTPSTSAVSGVQGYWAFLAWDNGVSSSPKWILVRSDGTNATELASAGTTGAALSLNSCRKIRMRIQDTAGGDPAIYVDTATVSAISPSPVWSNVLTFTDTSANQITDPGRVGFITPSEQGTSVNADGIARAYLINYVSAQNFDADTEVWRDDGTRYAPNAGRDVLLGLKSGKCMQSAWFGDLYNTSSTLTPLRQDVGNNRVTVDPSETGDTVGEFYCSQRLATDRENQDRSAQFVFLSGGGSPAGTRKAGVAVRVANLSGPSDSIGFAYYAVIERDDSAGTAEVSLYRRRTNQQGATQEKRMAVKTGVTINEDTAYRLRVQITNQETTTYPQIKVYLDGAQVELVKDETAGTGFPGSGALLFPGSGTVVDNTSNALAFGPGEALYLSVPDSVAHQIAVNDWTEESSTSPTDTPEQNQTSIGFTSETAGATGTLTVPIDWDVTLRRAQSVRGLELEGGYVYANAARQLQRRTWRVQQQAATESEVAALRSFWDSHRGSEIPFSWTPPHATSASVVRFVGGSLTDREKAPGVYDFGFELEELTDGA